MTDKIATTSAPIFDENLNKLREVFPNFVKDGQVDFDALQAFLKKDGVLADGEKYGINWAGKSDAFRAIRTPSTGTLAPQPEESKNWDDTENIFIEGDNLEVLKLLQKHYTQKIKMIYIDPPYNTGKDFVYKDNFHQGVVDYYEQTGQTKGGIKMTTNTEKNGRYHSDWLTMMYPRLFLARNLLKDDGVIFVSIADEEVGNLRLILDEIFGEDNFIGQLIHQRAKGGGQAKQIVKGHDYLMAYAKNIDSDIVLRRPKVVQQDVVEIEGKEFLRNDDILRKTFGKYDKSLGDRRCFYEEIEKYKGKEKKKEIDERIAKGELVLEKFKDGMRVIVEYVPLDEASSKLYSIIKVLSEEGKNDLEELGLSEFFDYPKPVEFVTQLVQAVTLKSKKEDDVILDFFAGSGTTAQAVMVQNVADEGNRKWICVQLPESTDEDSEAYKAGYKKISDISRERIRRAGDKIGKGDVGFKSYRLSQSNHRQWQPITEEGDTALLLKQSKMLLDHPLVDGYDEMSVVCEILVKEGYDLNSTIFKVDSGDTDIPWPHYIVGDKAPKTEAARSMIITFTEKINAKDLENAKIKLADLFVCFDSALDDTGKVNAGREGNIKTI